MATAEKPEDAAAALTALEAARVERARLSELGRWSEADEAAMNTLRDVLAIASPDIVGPDLGGLVYVAGSPRPGPQTAGRNGHSVPAERLIATCAMLLVNRGSDRQTAVEMVHKALKSFTWRDLGTFWYSMLTLAYADEGETALHHLERARTRAGWGESSAIVVLRARITALGGRPEAAIRICEDFLRSAVQDQFTEVAAAWTIDALVDLGELDRAEVLVHDHGFQGDLAGVVDRAEVLAARGALRQAAGRAEAAYHDFIACGSEFAGWGVTNPAVIPWQSHAALCATASGRKTLAALLAERELDQARRWGTPRAIGTALRASAHVSAGEAGTAVLQEAVGLLARSGAHSTLMRAQYELGVRLGLQEQHAAAMAAMLDSRETARSTDHKPWATRLDRAIGRCDAHPRTSTKLTPREREVVNLARSGLVNAEIADSLHLTESTIEYHLSNVYRKLGMSGRTDLRDIQIPVF
ncbi:helix-turn-helix transcriptional regulator [Amycolatopsis sp. NPDC051061]|uniref:helix-turn-helix transcriptional regulator n=1 Tax=Amycolatopsis sp. NPDC051061 TaxID=3155042 RepID=UPI0034138C36